jgi:hypothetical protein
MKITIKFIFAALVLLTSNACVKNPPGEGTGTDDLKSLPDAFNVPRDVHDLTNTILNTAVYVLYEAFTRKGALVFHGTLRAVDDELFYEDFPTDRLTYIPKKGGAVDFFFLKVEGDLRGGYVRFLHDSHRLEFRVASQEYLKFDISSIQNGIQRRIKTTGPVNMRGISYHVEVLLEGTYKLNSGNTGSELEVDAAYTGRIEGQNFKEILDERWRYNSVYASGKYVSENISRRFENQWTAGARQFKFRDGLIQSVFRDGKPSEWDVSNSPWKARGELLIDDQSYGQLLLEKDDRYLRVWLQTDDQRTEMTHWQL